MKEKLLSAARSVSVVGLVFILGGVTTLISGGKPAIPLSARLVDTGTIALVFPGITIGYYTIQEARANRGPRC